MVLISSSSFKCFFSIKIFHIPYFYFFIFFVCVISLTKTKLGIWTDTLSIIFPLSIFLSIVLIKMLLIRFGLFLATILIGPRKQGRRKLEFIRFKNSLIIEFSSYLRMSKLKSPVTTVTLLMLHNFVGVSSSFNKNKLSDLDVCSVLLLTY